MFRRSLTSVGRSGGQLLRAKVCWAIGLSLLAVQGWVDLRGGVAAHEGLYELLALRLDRVLAGAWWQLPAHALLHGNFTHALVNVICLLLLGSRVEYMAGGRTLGLLVALGVAGGAALHLALAPGGPGAPALVGMSGGCVALLLWLTTVSPESRFFPLPFVSGRSLGAGVLLASLLLALADPGAGRPGFSQAGQWLAGRGAGDWFGIGHACHLGGGLAGWAVARWMLRPRVSLEGLRRARARRERREGS